MWWPTVAVAMLCVLAATAATLAWLWPRYPTTTAKPLPFLAERLSEQAIIHAGLAEPAWEADGYLNINGPALIRVPDWIKQPLGTYYLYFAHHKGSHIRLAYADALTGPWTVRPGGALSLADSGFPTTLPDVAAAPSALSVLWGSFSIHVVRDHLLMRRAGLADRAERRARGLAPSAPLKPHIASPEIVVDRERRRLLMFYHGLTPSGLQTSRMAVSADGLSFVATETVVPSPYLRAFAHRDRHYLLGMPGVLYRARHAGGLYTPRRHALFGPDMRHSGLHVAGDILYVFWSRVGDAPERILVSTVGLRPADWNDWRASEPQTVLHPETAWEGAELPRRRSLRGERAEPAHELRDPFVFQDADGQRYLLYAGGGERAIGIARLAGYR